MKLGCIITTLVSPTKNMHIVVNYQNIYDKKMKPVNLP